MDGKEGNVDPQFLLALKGRHVWLADLICTTFANGVGEKVIADTYDGVVCVRWEVGEQESVSRTVVVFWDETD